MVGFFLVCVYLLMASNLFFTWLEFFHASHLSVKEKKISWIVLILATIFWPIVVPISYMELLSKRKETLVQQLNNSHKIKAAIQVVTKV